MLRTLRPGPVKPVLASQGSAKCQIERGFAFCTRLPARLRTSVITRLSLYTRISPHYLHILPSHLTSTSYLHILPPHLTSISYLHILPSYLTSIFSLYLIAPWESQAIWLSLRMSRGSIIATRARMRGKRVPEGCECS
jgi:hypothetical protein